jgi:hypothetical protein
MHQNVIQSSNKTNGNSSAIPERKFKLEVVNVIEYILQTIHSTPSGNYYMLEIIIFGRLLCAVRHEILG